MDEASVAAGNSLLGLLIYHGYRSMMLVHGLFLRLENGLLAFNLGTRNSFSKVFTKKYITIFLTYTIVLLYTLWYNNHSIFRKETTNMDLIVSFLKVMSNNEYNYFKNFQTLFRYVNQISYDVIKETSLPLIKRHKVVFLRVLLVWKKYKHMIYTILFEFYFMYTYPFILQDIMKGFMSHFLWKCEIHPFSVLMFTSMLTQQNLNFKKNSKRI